jgi:hypothetical protein
MTKDEEAMVAPVLAALKKHPDGMTLRDLGNFLGVNWRSLVGVVSDLLRKGNVERLDSLYFFVRKRSSRRKG